MKKTTHTTWFQGAAVVGVLTASLMSGLAAGPQVVYDNSQNPLNTYFSSQTEFGDQITIGAGWVADSFTFEYYASGLSGNEKARVRFYRNDGLPINDVPPAFPGALQSPGGLLYQSPEFTIKDGNFPQQIINLLPLNIELPPTFTWTVALTSGWAPGEVFGLKLYDPPTVGTSFNDIWVWDNGWKLKQIEGLGGDANFGAVLTAVPEPGAASLLAVGGLALLLRRRR